MDFPYFLNFIAFILCLHSLKVSTALDSLHHSQFLRDDGTSTTTTLVSKGRTFELGFFSPGNSKNRYLGIWYKNIPIQTVVWVANGLNPINDSSGTLTMNTTGCLVLSSHNGTVVWYSTITNSRKRAQNATATLLDSGNLVVCEEKNSNSNPDQDCLWQSFDHASDTLLPGMRIGWNIRRGLNWTLTAWKSPDDPAPGDFTCLAVQNDYPDAYLMKGAEKYSRYGPFNGLISSGSPQINNNSVYIFQYVQNKDEYYYTYYLTNNSVISRIVMNQTDYTRYRYVWVDEDQTWMVYKSNPIDYCDHYNLCGANGNCIITETPICQCLKGFTPKSPEAWNLMGWSQGCVRDKPLSCMEKLTDGFVRLEDLKVPDTTLTWVDRTIGLEECRAKCLNNCSCTAFSNTDIRGGGSGCVMWFGDLVDIRQFQSRGQYLYVRMPASELDVESKHRKNLTTIVATTIAGIAGMLLVGCYFIHKFRRNISEKLTNIPVQNNGGPEYDLGLPLLSMSTLASATSNFSEENKIGEGGFGPVYKGRLIDGNDIAVKRLSSSSGQGINEFKNEVKLIAKLQHRNLVKLVGCCIQEKEQMLVYEYMPNGSLDSFIFDHNKGKLLDWPKRFHIISGIARGLTYLHQDSRLIIIHRDLKTSNILLDDKLNPKISDFGTARTFGEEQIEGNTNRVVGTYGYMAPEYIAGGLFSAKSDVFSFGIMVLEIIYGKKSRGFYHSDHHHNLIGHAWILWKEGRASELLDENIQNSWILSEVLRCIHVSLLCVQRHPDDRPNMSSVLLMLGSEKEIPEPKQPGFFLEQANSSTNQMQSESSNEISMTLLEAR
ncbi:hypothetical protein RIF29_22725 [Crotalaria pallida]|uniref:Receptor-like serine/threonine-protein kinase n=1 Tax=Crotalaria pallida TaxID=3830 RepID=A0AAN9I724_CROPI